MLKYRIEQDEYPRDPREDGNLGTMVCAHKRYTLGDEQFDSGLYDGWEEVEHGMQVDPEWPDEEVAEGVVPKGAVRLPLYLMDHSGISISTSSFSCPWDSGQVGFIYVTLERMQHMMCWGDKHPGDWEEQAVRHLEAEVQTYNMYLAGDVYGIIITDGEEEVDSCWGYFGREYVEVEAKEMILCLQNS